MKQNSFWVTQALLWVALFCCLSGPAQAANQPMAPQQQVQSIQTLEDAFFAIRYEQEPMEARLSRLEQTVFGQAQTGSLDARITKLKSVLSPGSLGPLSPTAKTENTAAPIASQLPAKTAAPKVITKTAQQGKTPAPGETDYPTVSQMEQKLFGKTFVQEDITNRLNRLEQQVFHMTQNGVLSDRVDNLRLVVLGDTGTSSSPSYSTYGGGGYGYNQNPYPPPGNYQGGYNNGPLASTQPNYGQPPNYGSPYPGVPQDNMNMPPGNLSGNASPDTLAAINDVEKEVLGHTFPLEPVNSRLDRLENKIFHTTSPEMTPDDRVQRVIAVASAGGAPQSAQAKAKSTMQVLLPIILTILPLILL